MLVPTSLPTIIYCILRPFRIRRYHSYLISPFTISDTTLQVYNLTPGKPPTKNCKFYALPMDFQEMFIDGASLYNGHTCCSVSNSLYTYMHHLVYKVTGKYSSGSASLRIFTRPFHSQPRVSLITLMSSSGVIT